MRLLWLCNNAPGAVRSALTGKELGGVNWVDHVLSDIRRTGAEVRILFRGNGGQGQVDENCSFRAIGEGLPWEYDPALETMFRQEIRTFQPDVIHSWGVEYAHALALVNAAEAEGMLDRTIASIQGLCRFLAEHYCDGIPEGWQRKQTLRDLLRKDSILAQQERFRARGELEVQTVKKLRHVIGRTRWDREKTLEMNPEREYHFCNETLRPCFYEGQWEYGRCVPHRIFASSCSYPIKGFHYLLEAFALVKKAFPDAALAVTGRSFLPKDLKGKLRQNSYEAYLASLAKKDKLEDSLLFLGDLSAEQMKEAYLQANVFCLSSTLENSPNALGEAMLLGVPCAASRVGGVEDLLDGNREGAVYDSADVKEMARGIIRLFALEGKAGSVGAEARNHAKITHDPQINLKDLLAVYEDLMKHPRGERE